MEAIKEIEEENKAARAEANESIEGQGVMPPDDGRAEYMGWIIDDFPGTAEQVRHVITILFPSPGTFGCVKRRAARLSFTPPDAWNRHEFHANHCVNEPCVLLKRDAIPGTHVNWLFFVKVVTHQHHASLSGRSFGEMSFRLRRECSRTVEDGRSFQACTSMCFIGRDNGEGLRDILSSKCFPISAIQVVDRHSPM